MIVKAEVLGEQIRSVWQPLTPIPFYRALLIGLTTGKRRRHCDSSYLSGPRIRPYLDQEVAYWWRSWRLGRILDVCRWWEWCGTPKKDNRCRWEVGLLREDYHHNNNDHHHYDYQNTETSDYLCAVLPYDIRFPTCDGVINFELEF
jgi:hypothetical protein